MGIDSGLLYDRFGSKPAGRDRQDSANCIHYEAHSAYLSPVPCHSEFNMRGHLSHNEYVEFKRRQVVETAQAMLNGQLAYLAGSRQLSALRHEVDVADSDADFLTFVGIDSDTDALPLGEVRHDGIGVRRR